MKEKTAEKYHENSIPIDDNFLKINITKDNLTNILMIIHNKTKHNHPTEGEG